MAFIDCHFFSEVLGLSTSMYVILPQPTSRQIGMTGASGSGPHKVLYLLHGRSDDHTIWLRRTSIERYVAPLGLAVVMPAVDRSFYSDMASGPRYWTFVSEELPALCQAFFPISGKREDTYAAGLSMGGYGAFRLGLACPEKYAAVASLSGAVAIGSRLADSEGEGRREWESIWGDLTRFVGSPNDLTHLAKELAASNKPRPRLFQWCGTDDFLYQGNVCFRDHLRSLGLEVTYSEGPGGHSWDMWDVQIQNVLAWLDLPAMP